MSVFHQENRVIPVNHLWVLSQPGFVRRQVDEALSGRRLAFWRRGAAA